MKKIYFLTFVFLMTGLLTAASNVKSNTASEVAKNYYWNSSAGIKSIAYDDITPFLVYTGYANEAPGFYVFNINMNDGYVIVSAENATLPVLGIGFYGNYVPGDEPPALINLLEHYLEQIRYARENGLEATEKASMLWDKYLQKAPHPEQTRGVSPLISTTWNQDCWYNEQCPADASGPCGHVYTGCGATAMAQHMKYYQHPATGTGSHSYTHPTYGVQSANFGATTYNFSAMPNSISSSNSDIAQLMYHCGVSVDMDYGPTGSGCYNTAIDAALKTYFGYSSAAAWDWRSNYTDPQWLALVKAELDNGDPLIYYGNDNTNGHFFNCDGYNDSDQLHMNWGWSGSYDGYFTITNLVPTPGYVFTYNQGAIFNAVPGSTSTYCSASGGCGNLALQKVQFQSIDNFSNCSNYTDYSASYIASLEQGGQYTIRVVANYISSFVNSTVNGWADWNQDFDFDDSGESFTLDYKYNYTLLPNDIEAIYEGTVSVPAGANTGTTKLRIRITPATTSNTPCGSTDEGEVEDYGLNITGGDPPPAATYPFLFSVDIGADTELSDPQADSDEVFDPGDAYLYNGALLPSGGADGVINDGLFFTADPAPTPGTGSGAPVGIGGELPEAMFFDMDGIDQTMTPLSQLDFGPSQPPISQFADPLIYEPLFLLISYDDDIASNYTDASGSVAVNSASPALGAIYGKSANQDEVVQSDFPPGTTLPKASSYTGSVADEVPLHYNLLPDPLGDNIPDDDVDALDVNNPEYSSTAHTYFSADHEAVFTDPNTGNKLDPANIYQSPPGSAGFIEVINGQIHLGLPLKTDVDAFEFTWIFHTEFGYPALAMLFSVDDDDPLTPDDESGGLDSKMIYCSFLDGSHEAFSEEPMNDDVDAIAITPTSYINNPNIPDAGFGSDLNLVPTGSSVTFFDQSTGNPTTWDWTFNGGNPGTYSGQIPPPIYYNTAGLYDVTLNVSNAYGSDSETKTQYIDVVDYPAGWDFNITASSHLISVPTSINFVNNPLQYGDFFGVFYIDENGNEKCGGANVWDGTNNKVVVAFGDDMTTSGVKEGFEDGEDFIWKVYYTGTSTEKYAEVTYNTALPNHDGKFYDNGLSGLLSMDTDPLVVDATAVPDYVCEGEEVQLDAVTSGGTGTYSWQWTSDPAGFNSTEQSPLAYPAEDTKYFVTVDDGNSTKTDSVEVTTAPMPTVDAGIDATICETSFKTLSGTAQNYGTVSWSTDGDGSFVNQNSLTATYYPGPGDKASGSVVLTLSASALTPCTGSVDDNMTLTIINNPDANAGTDKEICENQNYTISGSSATNYQTLLWETSGDGSFNNNTALHPTYFPGSGDLTAGSVTLTLNANPVNPCTQSASDFMILSFSPVPTADAGPNSTICETGTFAPSATAANYSSLTWSTSGDGTFDNRFVIDPVYTPGTNDVAAGTAILTLEAAPINPCTVSASDDLTLSIVAEPEAEAGVDATICSTSSYQLSGAVTNACNQYWYSNGDGSFDNSGLADATYTPGTGDIAAGSVQLCFVAEPCDPCTLEAEDCMTLHIQAAPSIDPLSDVTICETQSQVCPDATTANAASLSWTSSGDGTFDDASLEDPCYTIGASDITTGSVELCLEAAPIDPCVAFVTECFTITIFKEPAANAGADAMICSSATLTLNGSVENACGNYWYTNGDGTFDNTGLLAATYSPGSADLAAGSVEVCLVAEPCDPCTLENTDCLIISFQEPPAIEPMNNVTVCENQTEICIDATVSNAESLLWSTTGDGTFDNETIEDPCYAFSPGDILMGGIELCLTAQPIDPCSIAAEECFNVTFQPQPMANAGADAEICEGDLIQLNGMVSEACGYYWYSNGDGSFSNTGLLNATYDPGSGDAAAGSVELCLVAEPCTPCTVEHTDCVTIFIQAAPVINPLGDLTICETDVPVCIDATVLNASSLLWSSTGDGSFDDETMEDPCYTPGILDIENGQVQLCLTAEPINPCTVAEQECFNLIIQSLPEITELADQTICENDIYCIDANVDFYASLLWSSTGDGFFDDETAEDPCYTPGTLDLENGGAELCLTAEPIDPCAVADVECFMLSITLQPEVANLPDVTICAEDNYCINASAENYSSLIWTTNGDGNFDDAGIEDPCYTPGDNDINNSSVELCLTAQPIDPCTAQATECFILHIQQTPSADAGEDFAICQGNQATLNGVAENECGFSWSSTGDGTFDDTGLLQTTYTPGPGDETAGNLEICLTVEACDPCTIAATDCMTLTIQPQPTVDPLDNITVCENAGPVCLDANAANYASLSWFTGGDGSFDDNTIEDPCYTAGADDIANGSVELCISAQPIEPCLVAATECLVITYQPLPAANAGMDATICETDAVILNGTVENACGFYWYSNGDGTFDDTGLLAATYTPGTQDIENAFVEICLVAQPCDPCADEMTDCVGITIQHLPTAYAGEDATIGEGGFYNLLGASAENYSALLWTTGGDGTFDDQSLLNATYTPGAEDTSNGSVELCLTAEPIDPCTLNASDCMILSIEVAPIAYAGPDQAICEGSLVNLDEATADNYLSLEWTTVGDGTFDDITALNPVYTPGANDISNGTVQLCLNAYPIPPSTITATDCMVVEIQKSPTIDPLDDQTICEGTVVCINATAANFSSLLWTTSGTGTFDTPEEEDACYSYSQADVDAGSVELCLTAEPVDPCLVAAEDCMTLTINPEPAIGFCVNGNLADTGEQFEFCYDTEVEVTLCEIWSGTGPFEVCYTVNEEPEVCVTVSEGGSLFTDFLAPGTYEVQVTSITDNNGCTVADLSPYMLTVVIHPEPAVGFCVNGNLADTGEQFEFCYDTEVEVTLCEVWSGEGPFEVCYTVNEEPEVCVTVNQGESLFTNLLDPDNYHVQVTSITDASGCIASNVTPYTLDVTILPEPAVLFCFNGVEASTGSVFEYCEGTTVAVSLCSVLAGEAPFEVCYTVNAEPEACATVHEGDLLFSDALLPGSYTVQVTSIIDANGCVVADASVYNAVVNIQATPFIEPLADDTLCSEQQVYCFEAIAENYSSLLWSTSGDGNFDDATITNACYTAGPADLANGSVQLCLTAQPVDPCTPAAEECMTLTVGQLQVISVTGGWSGISGYVQPFDDDIENVMAPVIDELILMYNPISGIFAPDYNINSLANWNSQEGYVIKVSNSVELNICGNPLASNSIDLTEGWNLVPVPVEGSVAVTDAVAGISDELIIVKEVAGYLMYYPEYGIQTLTDFVSGKAYFIKVNADCTLTFPTEAMKTGSIQYHPHRENITPWNDVIFTPGSHIFVLTGEVTAKFQEGDVVGAFNQKGRCGGWTEIAKPGEQVALSVHASDPYDASDYGFNRDEIVGFKLYRPSSGQVTNIALLDDDRNDFTFEHHGISIVKSAEAGSISVQLQKPDIYPNPTDGDLYISFPGVMKDEYAIALFDIYGDIIRDFENYTGDARLNLPELSAGVYLLKIKYKGNTFSEKIVVK